MFKRPFLVSLFVLSSYVPNIRDIASWAQEGRINPVPVEVLISEIGRGNLYPNSEILTGGYLRDCIHQSDGSILARLVPTPRAEEYLAVHFLNPEGGRSFSGIARGLRGTLRREGEGEIFVGTHATEFGC